MPARLLLAAKNARLINRRPRSSPRPYPLRGLLFCGIGQRRMQSAGRSPTVVAELNTFLVAEGVRPATALGWFTDSLAFATYHLEPGE